MAWCKHIDKVDTPERPPVIPSGHGCKECLATNGRWVHLRLCLDCGHVGCCDSSPNRHATAHFHETSHPVVRVFEPEERWAWCYPDELMVDAIPSLPGEMPPRHYDPP